MSSERKSFVSAENQECNQDPTNQSIKEEAQEQDQNAF
jgi:hypothetical protein